MSIPWYPPVDGKAYNFRKDEDFTIYVDSTNVANTGFIDYTHYPYFSAIFNSQGKVIPQTGPTQTTAVTSWGQYSMGVEYPFNRARNIYQTLNIFRN